jgi:hypothetical protein
VTADPRNGCSIFHGPRFECQTGTSTAKKILQSICLASVLDSGGSGDLDVKMLETITLSTVGL